MPDNQRSTLVAVAECWSHSMWSEMTEIQREEAKHGSAPSRREVVLSRIFEGVPAEQDVLDALAVTAWAVSNYDGFARLSGYVLIDQRDWSGLSKPRKERIEEEMEYSWAPSVRTCYTLDDVGALLPGLCATPALPRIEGTPRLPHAVERAIK